MRAVHLLLPLAALFVITACGGRSDPPPPDLKTSVHVVRKGENLYRLSKRYGTTVDAIARANHLRDPTAIAVGQRLVIPGRTRGSIGKSGTWTGADPRGRSAAPNLGWPVAGKVSSGFGMRNGARHEGVDIPARMGSHVRAAEAGRVVHSNNSLAGYGNMIIVKHAGNLSTVYAHNRKNLVRMGQFVKKGQVIAEVGQTGRATRPHVHFEVRRDGRPRNPLEYLE